MKKEDIDKLLFALENAEPHTPSDQLLGRLEDLAVNHVEEKDQSSWTYIVGIAASLLVLLSINIWIMQDIAPQTSEAPPQGQFSSQPYDLIPAKSIYSWKNLRHFTQ